MKKLILFTTLILSHISYAQDYSALLDFEGVEISMTKDKYTNLCNGTVSDQKVESKLQKYVGQASVSEIRFANTDCDALLSLNEEKYVNIKVIEKIEAPQKCRYDSNSSHYQQGKYTYLNITFNYNDNTFQGITSSFSYVVDSCDRIYDER